MQRIVDYGNNEASFITAGQSAGKVRGKVRYWFDQCDEELQRELNRRRSLGIGLPEQDQSARVWLILLSSIPLIALLAIMASVVPGLFR
ncbi:MAG: hypothetical protein DMG91_02155 [Acidobacteria bacterium]|nr:MAG: hypothetical protein DMG91_02155 [Acidobacteriota bacterium]